MSVGDVNSSEAGSGARYNDGKKPMHQIPVIYWIRAWQESERIPARVADPRGARDFPIQSLLASDILDALHFFQKTKDLDSVISPFARLLSNAENLEAAMEVFAYGEKKYALYNWAKGMAWSIPVACALRHIEAHLMGEDLDAESGLPHLSHALCNILMLDWFISTYPEGDDRPLAK